MKFESAAQRFQSKVEVDPVSGCHVWTAGKNQKGYAVFWSDGRQWKGHRWLVAQREPLTDDDVVRHTCDNPSCVKSEHLLVGTDMENRQDAVDRGRMRNGEVHDDI